MTDMPPASLDFTAIDFETANGLRASACAVGLAKVRGGRIVETASWLIKPPRGADEFLPWNVRIHGITAEQVAGERDWSEIYPEVMAFVAADDLVAHNAPFDRSVLQQTSSAFDLDWPTNRWFDTLPIARRTLTLGSYSLPFVAAELGIEDLTHHEALADATQAARIASALSERAGAATLDELLAMSGVVVGTGNRRTVASSGSPTRSTGDFSSLTASDVLADESIVFTGTLKLTKRSEAQALVEHFGGTVQGSVTKTTTILVSGDLDPRTLRPGTALSRKLDKAMTLATQGQPIEIWTEDDFHERLAVGREELEAATRAQRVPLHTPWLPAYVVEQAAARQDANAAYIPWLREALRHPNGLPGAEDTCIRCDGEIAEDLFLTLRERHVCSGDCNEVLKDTAKREWAKAGIVRPAAPSYAESWGRKR